MDSVLPSDVAGAIGSSRTASATGIARCRVRAGDIDLPVIELSETGFVIRADGPPPLRGYADLFRGDDRVMHGLVVCSWAENGLVGYEFKHETTAREIAPDHVPPVHAGLLTHR